MTTKRVLRALGGTGLVVLLLSGCAHSRPATEPADAAGSSSDAVVSADDIQRSSAESVAKALMGRVPGVWVSQNANGELSVRIRGTTTINGNKEPLYVIDGMPVAAGANGKLPGISVYDIETIEVLKDVASTSMYGVRGANGVIVIRTKQAGG